MQESQIRRIFSTMINQKLEVFREEVKPVGEILAQATLNLYFAVSAHFLPTPSKIHYLFNLRDISKVHSHTQLDQVLELIYTHQHELVCINNAKHL